ncbi:MAG: respiratory nitrate reductase subunit gamma [Desulfuromonas sp.]
MSDLILFVMFPYVATSLAICGGIYRYFRDRFTFSSLSSQLLEHRFLFWGTVPWHYAIISILLAHLLPIIFPGWVGSLLGGPNQRTAIELVGKSLGMLAFVGIAILLARRLINAKARAVTSVMDWILLLLLLIQVALGIYISSNYRWGALWYNYTAVPWLQSLALFRPDIAPVIHLPVAVKLHMVNAFILILLFPFTRLVHIFTFPIRYLVRSWQLVWWNR